MAQSPGGTLIRRRKVPFADAPSVHFGNGLSAGSPYGLWGYLPKAASAQLEADYGQHTQIICATGEVVGRVTEQGDGFTLAEVELAGEMPKPDAPQPKMRTPGIAFFIADVFAPALLKFVYRRGLRRKP